ncbi:uncharacterized protein LOC106181007 isoform X2 [Lingula anatina]|uniref:Uncharacterized protein LOC106181007 isoform X2 n=1 Tax=Lingula anatina TaxID=7574 RepID=A0A1S3KEM6_LINAN|nr:uncharacterized protein LOC106181007 isoform X2 [Lingula anatina]|eukprot:XP_013420696.1 uncharacterized protein LOC106181007 isoform X2 [Lingula anatina]
MSQPVDPVIVNKIKELYRHNMRKASLIETYIHLFVKDDVFKGKECPSRLNRRWFPTLKDIKNIATCQSKNPNDQVNLADYVNQQKAVNPEDLIFFRASSLGENQKVNFLFVYQTKWQRRLLKRYGNHITLMDATYRTSRYAMPLFFICVKTNVNFTVVASFLVETENQESIMEALAIIKKYSPEWDPEHMMVDYSMSEINALEASFPETKILLCDFHREKSWKEWVSKIQNGVSGCQEECLGILRALAHSPTVTDYKETLAHFKSSDLWKDNPKFRTYFSNHWECRAEKWVKAYRGTLLIPVNSNNGLERQNLALKDSYLQGFKNCTIEALVKVLVEMFIPNSFVRYQQLNIRCSAEKRQYSQEVPTFLHNRPVQFVRHIMDRWTTFNISNVKRLSSNHFKAKNDDQTEYNISLDPCCCECPDFCQHKIPCKHLCAVLKFPGVSWSSLGSIFNSNPAYLLDEDVIDQSPVSYSDEISTVTSEPPPLTSESHPTETDVIINDLPKRKKNVAKEQSICISLAKELLDSLYQIDSLQDLQHIRKQIGMVLEEAKGAIPHEYGLPKKPKSPRKKPKVSPKTKIGSLPQRQKKLQLMKRVGKGAEIARRKRGLSDLNLSQAAKPSAVPPIKKVCVEAKKQESPSSPKAQNKIKIHLNRYAVPSQNTNVTLGKYKSHHITYDSITSINGMLADEVIDSYLDIMISNSGKKVFHVSLHVMSRIVYDGDMTYFSKKDLREYDIIVGVCIRRGHYSVLHLFQKKRNWMPVCHHRP